MSKMNTVCLRCGKVQIRTDIEEEITGKYIQLKKTLICPKCEIKTNQIATNNVQTLRKQIEENPSSSLDGYILKLIKR